MPVVASLALCVILADEGARLPIDRPLPPRAPVATRLGSALLGIGGAAMLVGAGVLVPIAMLRASRAQAPNPDHYTAVRPFEHDLYLYKLELYRASQLGLAGAITSVAGATLFVAGAISWGVGRHRARRSHLAFTPGRGSVSAAVTFRF